MYNLTAPLFWFKFVFLAEIVIAEAIIAYRMKKKKDIVWRIVIAAVCLLAVTFALPVPFYNAVYSSFLFIVIFMCTLVALKFCLDESWGNVVFCGFFSYNEQHIAFQLYSMISLFLGIDVNSSIYGGDPSAGIDGLAVLVFCAANVAVYTCCWAIMTYHANRRKGTFRLRSVRILVLSIVVVMLNVILHAFVVYDLPPDLPKFVSFVIVFYNIFVCVLALIMQTSLVVREELETELKFVEDMWHRNERIYELSKVNVDFINMKCHDLRHRIRNARKRINVDENELEEIEQAIDIYDGFLKTGNDVLDVILSEESIFCNKNNIKLLCNVDGSCLNFIRQADLYSIFQNSIHNAIDAVMKIKDDDRRIIRLTVKCVESMISISMENYIAEGEALEFSDGLPVSENKDRNFHGFGMRSMRISVERYGGCICADAKDGIFVLDIMIPVRKDNA